MNSPRTGQPASERAGGAPHTRQDSISGPAGDGQTVGRWRLARMALGKKGRLVLLVGWLILTALALPFALRIGSAESNDLLSFLPSKAQSTKVLRLLQQLPSGRNLQAIVAFGRTGGLTANDQQSISYAARAIAVARIPGTGAVSGVITSPERRVALFSVAVAPEQNVLVNAVSTLHRMIPRMPGMQVELTGTAGLDADLFSSFSGVDTKLLIATAALVIILLLVTYQSPILWLVPIVGVVLAVVVAYAVVYGLARAGLTVTGENVGLLTVIVFGAGTDYALLLTARYREQLRLHAECREAMAVALSKSLPAIAASGATVAAALLCLLVTGFNVTRSFGIVGAVGVCAAFVAMVTVYPVLLVLCGRLVFWPRTPLLGSPEPTDRGVWASIAKRLAARPRPYWAGAGAALGVLALGLLTVNTSITTLDDLPSSSSAVRGAKLLLEGFPAGTAAPVDVIVTDPKTLGRVRAATARTPGVSSLGATERAGDLAHFQVVLNSVPSGERAFSLIQRLRTTAAAASNGSTLVGGQTAQDYDVATISRQDALAVIPLVLVVVGVVLWLLLRAVLGPVLVLLTVIATFVAALGAASVIFDSVLAYPGVDPTVPLLSFVFLVALGVDYNVFLLGRISDEIGGLGTTGGVVKGLAATGSVLTSAGLILAGTFSVLIILPLLPSKEIGLVVAAGVLIDTAVVRTVVVPALAIDLGSAFWWPRRLSPARRSRGLRSS